MFKEDFVIRASSQAWVIMVMNRYEIGIYSYSSWGMHTTTKYTTQLVTTPFTLVLSRQSPGLNLFVALTALPVGAKSETPSEAFC